MNLEERLDWEKIIRTNILNLKMIGLWPAGNKSYQRNFYSVYAIISISFVQVGHILLETINIFQNYDDLTAITGTFFVLLVQMMGMLKAYLLIKNMVMLKELITIINYDLFQPKNIRQKELIQPNINNWIIIVNAFRFFVFGWICFAGLHPILDKTYEEYNLPCLAWFPYNTKTSPQYEISYIYQVLAISFISMTNVNVDTLIAALNMFIGAQMDILYDDLRHINNGNKTDCVEANNKLLNCINHHKEILKFADKANEFYNWLLFIEFLVGAISIGVSMFQLTVVIPLSSEFYSFAVYVICIVLQVFLYCWFGNEIEIKSSKLPYAVFESNWTELSEELKQNMIILVLRLHRTLTISALGLFNLSLETFVKILKTAYTYFALLRRINMVDVV